MSVRDLGLALARALPWAESVGRKLYGLLPAALHDTPTKRAQNFFAGELNLHFMQIGAYDGVSGDPLRSLVLNNTNWSGVLVEPQPDAFAKLQRNYSKQAARLKFVNAAISNRAGELPFYFIPPDEIDRLRLPDWGSELASFDCNHLTKHFPHARIAQRQVQTMTFADIARLLPE